LISKDEAGFNYAHVQLLAKKDGDYSLYVFKNLDDGQSYIMCTKCPNWNQDDLQLFQEGYLKYKSVIGYRDKWFDPKTMQEFFYKFSANYFYEFIPVTHVINGNQIIEKELLIT
jgi:hypothetical protein